MKKKKKKAKPSSLEEEILSLFEIKEKTSPSSGALSFAQHP
jgi:hypothetical protein